jgi:cardiolipin synthase
MNDAVETVSWIALAATVIHLLIVGIIIVRVLLQRRQSGSTAAWLLLVIFLPYAGAILYLLVGERPLGKRRKNHSISIINSVEAWLQKLIGRTSGTPKPLADDHLRGIIRLAENTVGLSALPDNQLTLIDDAEAILQSVISDIEQARHFCLLEFYIWNPGGTADEVAKALITAAGRGVRCRVLLDDVGSTHFFKSPWPDRLRQADIEVRRALPAALYRGSFRRRDLRMHRKIVVIDGHIGYTGSLNLVDPRYFKQDAGVGQWVDAMARIQGPIVEALAGLFAWDWSQEGGESFQSLINEFDVPVETNNGEALVQIVPSGPEYLDSSIVPVMLNAIYAAREELILTTPYFVPNEALMTALCTAAQRGVRVRLIVPARVDSFLVRHASRSFFSELLKAGVEILLFDSGLLHTKSIVIDREVAFFGTLNLDIRSFHLNFEVTLVVLDHDFAERLAALCDQYANASEPLESTVWEARSTGQRLIENTMHLMAPLL